MFLYHFFLKNKLRDPKNGGTSYQQVGLSVTISHLVFPGANGLGDRYLQNAWHGGQEASWANYTGVVMELDVEKSFLEGVKKVMAEWKVV